MYSASMEEKKQLQTLAAQKEEEKRQQQEKDKSNAILTAQKLASLEDSEKKIECRTKSQF